MGLCRAIIRIANSRRLLIRMPWQARFRRFIRIVVGPNWGPIGRLGCWFCSFSKTFRTGKMERFMAENLAEKWFCGFGLSERAPDHSLFGDFRKRLWTQPLVDIFNRLRASLKAAGSIREVFTFVDASQLVSKLSTWDDRDRAIARGLEKFNNETAPKVAADKQARFGAKGKGQFWYGYIPAPRKVGTGFRIR
jgi:hypothetical protein